MFVLDKSIDFAKKKNDVLTVGELLVDMIAMDYNGSGKYQRYFGGAPANIAMNVKRLGGNSLIASAVGKDYFGDFLMDSLRESFIDVSLVQRVEESTSMVLLNRSNGTPTPIFYRVADCQLNYTDNLGMALMDSKIMHFSSWSISKKPIRNTIERLISIAKESKTLICFDPNYHESLWENGEDGVCYVKSIIGMSDIVKPSEDDAARIFGVDSPKNQISKFLDLGAKLVIMTLGKDGLIVANGDEVFEYRTLANEVMDTTGAGDAFWAGFYTSLVRGYSIRDAVVLGSAASAYKLKYVGAVVDLPNLEELKNIYQL